MADPPSYEESTAERAEKHHTSNSDVKGPQRFSIREEVGLSRSQHVAAVVEKLLPHVRDRARSGLSKSTLLLFPSDQDCSRKGELVGFAEDEPPLLIQLEGRQDTLEFWRQHEALSLLRSEMLASISDNVPTQLIEQPAPALREPPPQKTSFFNRKSSKAPVSKEAPKPARPPVEVDVQLDDVYFRSETEYGLYQTVGARAVILSVVVR